MTTPTVTEITRALEPVGRDMFVDGPHDPAALTGPQARYVYRGSEQEGALEGSPAPDLSALPPEAGIMGAARAAA